MENEPPRLLFHTDIYRPVSSSHALTDAYIPILNNVLLMARASCATRVKWPSRAEFTGVGPTNYALMKAIGQRLAREGGYKVKLARHMLLRGSGEDTPQYMAQLSIHIATGPYASVGSFTDKFHDTNKTKAVTVAAQKVSTRSQAKK